MMNRLKYILYMLLFTQLLSAGTLATPKIKKIKNNHPYSSTAGIFYTNNYDKNTHFKIFNYGKNIRTVETMGFPDSKKRISFFTKPNTNYLIQIQAVRGSSKSKLSKAVPFTSKLKFEFTAGKDETIVLGNTITLNGKVTKGDKNEIDFYKWEEKGEVLKNTEGDEILYWDEKNAENEYKPTKIGVHFLKFIITDLDGKEYSRILRIGVLKSSTIPVNKLHIDMKNIKWDKDSNSYITTMKLGEFITLSGKLIYQSGYDKLVDSYHWEKDGKILKNMVNDEILYWKEENRKNDYKPTKAGVEHLKFVVTDIYGNKVKKNLIVTIKKDIVDDHGNSKDDATKIALNTIVHGEKNYDNDHDFFSFTLDKKQYVEVHIKYSGKSKRATLYTSDLRVIKSHRSIPGSSLYRPINVLLEAGTYYVDASLYSGKYTLKIRTEDVVTVDEYGDTKETATEVFDGTTINSYINKTEDIDYFYFIPKDNGTVSITPTGVPRVQVKNNYYTYGEPITVKKGERFYFKVMLPSRTYNQHSYSFSLSFDK